MSLAVDENWSTFNATRFRETYFREGYAIVRGVFSPTEISALKSRFDTWRAEMVEQHESTFVKGNFRVWVGQSGGLGGEGSAKRILRGVQWPSYTDAQLDAIRTDDRLFAIVSSIIGPDVKQIINQMHWKQPGSLTQWRYHQDVRSRKPDSAYRELYSSYINLGIAIERQTDETGAMRVVPRTHLSRKDLGIEAVAEELGVDAHPPTEAELGEMLGRVGVNAAELHTLALEPGDVGIWNPFVVHGGGINTSKDCHRSFYIQGYGAAEHTDRGHVAWLSGVPQPLGEPVHVQLDNYKETIAEGGRYYPFNGAEAGRLDRIIEREAKEKTAAAAAAETLAMNLVRD